MKVLARAVCLGLVLSAGSILAASSTQTSKSLSQRLAQIKIAELEFREAELSAVISVLVNESRANFVLLDPEGKARSITLNLRDIPVDEAIRYIAEAAVMRYRYDKHAVVFFAPDAVDESMETRSYPVESGALKPHIVQPGEQGLLRRPEDF